LEAFKAGGSVQEVSDTLRYRADINVSNADAGYVIPKVLIWAMPIFGFIGTVIGISDAVGGFSTFTQSVQDVAELNKGIKTALGGVTGGLAVAFDTTLLALLLSVPVMVFTSYTQKREDEFLTEVDEFCLERVFTRLTEASTEEQGTIQFTMLTTSVERIYRLLEALYTRLTEDNQAQQEQGAEQLLHLKGFMETTAQLLEEGLQKQALLIGQLLQKSLAQHGQLLEQLVTDEVKLLGEKLTEAQTITVTVGQHLQTVLEQSATMAGQWQERQRTVAEQLHAIEPLTQELKAIITALSEERDALAHQGKQWSEALHGIVQQLSDTLQTITASLADERGTFVQQGKQWSEALHGTAQQVEETLKMTQAKLAEMQKRLEQPRLIRVKEINLVEDGLPPEE
jgi:hypothetical protein